jgi:uncharacterized protein (DUF1810 family)
MKDNLNRFIVAQEKDFEMAFHEIKSGQKKSHWMWYIFPQFHGLGFSETSKFYAIQNLDEANEYLDHPILGSRLREISNELLCLNENDAYKIFGSPDDSKLKSCMTLFSAIDKTENNIFHRVIEKYFNGELDDTTIKLINQ